MMNDKEKPPYVGLVARFFHPKTMGVMHTGKVVEVLSNGMVKVHFDIDDKTYITYPDYNKRAEL